MGEYFPRILIILFILFLLSMVNLFFYTHRKNKQRMNIKTLIHEDGFMKLYLRITNGHGHLDVLEVDGEVPYYSNEVFNKAIYLAPGEHQLTLSGKVKDNSVATNVLPYYTNLKTCKIHVVAKKNKVATLHYDVLTQNLTIEESEEKEDGVIQ